MANEQTQGLISGAAQGAATGGGWGAAVGAVGGLVGGKGAKKARRAAQAAARARQAQVNQYYSHQANLADRVNAAVNDPRELAMMTEAMNVQERNLGRQEEMIKAIDPALKEAAAQALQLMQGGEASSTAPLRAERQRQRQTLVNTLRAQLGPGAENSSAGQQALNRFDAESSNIFAQNQQSTLSGLLGIAERTNAGINLGQSAGQLQSLANARAGRIADGAAAQSNLMSNAFAQRIGTAGSNQAGNMMRGQFQQQLGGSLIGAAGSIGDALGGMSFGGGNSSLPTKIPGISMVPGAE